jgi:transcriptional regulator with XRE-family HTH domain
MTHPNTEASKDRDWFRRMAEFESACESISVGGLAHELGLLSTHSEEPNLKQSALGKLIELARRDARLSVEELASRADVELIELVELERGDPVSIEPRSIFRLCEVLKLPKPGVMELAGLTQRQDSSLGAAAVRFAANAKGLEKLTREERKAFEEFVRDLAESSDPR